MSLNTSSRVKQTERGIRNINSPFSMLSLAKAPYPPAGEGRIENLDEM